MDLKDTNGPSGIKRRDFLKAAGVGAAVLTMPVLMRNASAAPASSISQEIIETDVLIIGGGIAATFAAVHAKKSGADVTIVDKGTVGRSGLSPFFGGMAYYDKSGRYTREQYIESVSENGKYLVRREYLELFMDTSADIAEEFLSWGVGEDLSAKGGHGSTYRPQIIKNDIRLIERVMITELIKKNGKIAGAIGFPMDEDKAVIIKAKAVVLGTGSGALKTPGFFCNNITHDGDAMAYRIGAEITGKEFTDFHRTHWEFPADGWSTWGSSLSHGVKPRVWKPREWGHTPASSSIALEVQNGRIPYVIGSNGEAGGGHTRRPQHAVSGGATAGMAAHKCEGIFPKGNKCSSSIPGLFAAGDALFTFGAGYAGGTGSSSCGSAVQGAASGRYAAEYAKENKQQSISGSELTRLKERNFAPRTSETGFSPIWITQILQGIMVPYYVLYIKSQDRMEAALSTVKYLRKQFAQNMLANDTHALRLVHETRNMLLNSEMKLRAGLMRTETRGDHYREDFPNQDDKNWLAWIIITKDGDNMKFEKRPIPDEWKPNLANLPYEATKEAEGRGAE